MKVFVATVILATCLIIQAKNILGSPTNLLSEYYLKHSNGDSRIISGELAQSGQFPYQAGILITRNNGRFAVCGGALISSKWVLTAAHCVIDSKAFQIKFGGVRFNDYDVGQQVVKSTTAIYHENFDPSTLNYDIALIQLPNDVPLSDKIQPIRLPRRSEAADSLSNIKVTVSGWGNTSSTSGSSNLLYYVELDTISNDVCKRYYEQLADHNICCIGHPEHSTCKGDSGGPLVRLDEDGQRTHIGVVSFSSGAGCASGHPSAYVRTASFLDWIKDHTGITIIA